MKLRLSNAVSWIRPIQTGLHSSGDADCACHLTITRGFMLLLVEHQSIKSDSRRQQAECW